MNQNQFVPKSLSWTFVQLRDLATHTRQKNAKFAVKSGKKGTGETNVPQDRGTPVPYLNVEPVFLTQVDAVVSPQNEWSEGKIWRDRAGRQAEGSKSVQEQQAAGGSQHCS
jgi:hypothetical protein